jgi:hypothetical protein
LNLIRTRNLVLIVLILPAAILIANPFGNFAFNDDFSYSSLALNWAKTGHIHFNGWNTSALLLQMPLGGMVIRAFGFSFDALRYMTVAFYIGWAIILYYFLLEYEVSDAYAMFGTLAIALSPLTVPLAGSFMTDIYGCFTFYISLLAGLHALKQSQSILRASSWLFTSTIVGTVGGLNRQIVWLAPLAVMMTAVVIYRKRGWFLVVVFTNGLIFFASIMAVMSWLKTQPNFQYELLDLSSLLTAHAVINFIRYVLTCFLFSLPFFCAVSGSLAQALKKWKLVVTAAVHTGIVAFALLSITPHLPPGATGTVPSGEAPWTGSMVTVNGILVECADLLGHRPVILNHPVRILATILCLFAPILFFLAVFRRSNIPKLRQLAASESSVARGLLLLLILAGFFALILERATPIDRYIVQILPLLFVIVVTLRPAPAKPARLGWLSLFLFGVFAIANTHDYAATRRASVQALQQLERKGIDRYQVNAGLELDGFDHLQKVDYLRVCQANPPAGGPGCSNTFEGDWKTWWFRKATFSISGDYALSYSDLPGYERMDGITQDYRAWLPPFHRQIFGLKRETTSSASIRDAGAPK